MNLVQIKLHAETNFLESKKAVQDNNIKRVFSIAKPILVFCASFFLIPKKVRMILADLVEIMDILTGSENDINRALSLSTFEGEKPAGVSTSA